MLEQQKILIADDELMNRQLLSEMLKHDYRVILTKDGAQALEKSFEHQPDLIVLDVMMPGYNGYEVLLRLKEDERTRHIDVIFISALDSALDEEKGLKMGAVDYIAKPFTPVMTRTRIHNYMKMAQHKKWLATLAHIDSLTGLPHRSAFEHSFVLAWQQAKEQATHLSLALVDVDGFKSYNDHYGYAAGDQLLTLLSQVVRGQLDNGEWVARYHVGQWGVLLPLVTTDHAMTSMEKLRLAVVAMDIPHPLSQVEKIVTISIGGATMMPTEMTHHLELEAQAKIALENVKKGKRNQTVWFGNLCQ